mmetsp:Transcript_6942/g.22361  ORF Transcript_6942/g.22361 Transcript_6942/m.22361 type:complete len:257 (+) Transcript_6942:58-828(+)
MGLDGRRWPRRHARGLGRRRRHHRGGDARRERLARHGAQLGAKATARPGPRGAGRRGSVRPLSPAPAVHDMVTCSGARCPRSRRRSTREPRPAPARGRRSRCKSGRSRPAPGTAPAASRAFPAGCGRCPQRPRWSRPRSRSPRASRPGTPPGWSPRPRPRWRSRARPPPGATRCAGRTRCCTGRARRRRRPRRGCTTGRGGARAWWKAMSGGRCSPRRAPGTPGRRPTGSPTAPARRARTRGRGWRRRWRRARASC